MDQTNDREKRIITVKDLYPSFNEADLREAEETLNRYLEHSLRVFERLQNDPVEFAKFEELTHSSGRATIPGERQLSS